MTDQRLAVVFPTNAIEGAAEADPPAPNDRDLADLPLNDYGNAKRLIERHGRDMIHVDEAGWYIWDGKRFEKEPAQRQPESQKRAHLTALAIEDEARALEPELKPLRDELNDLKAAHGEAQRKYRDGSAEVRAAASAVERCSARVAILEDRIASHLKFGISSGNSGKISAMLKEAEPYRRKRAADLDAGDYKLNVGNGCLVLGPAKKDKATDEIAVEVRCRPHHRDDLMTLLTPVNYDPEASCPKFDAFLAEILPDPAIRRFLQTWFGYCLSGDVGEQIIVLFHGNGANGKSTLLSLIRHVLGGYGLTLPIQSFLQNERASGGGDATPDLARLPGSRLVMASEPERGSRLSEAVVKTVTGGETVVARRLFEGQFEFKPTFKLVLSANEKPRITGQDEGIWRRVVLIPFDAFIPRERRTKRLDLALMSEAAGILNWMLDGFRIWREKGLTIPTAVVEATDRYRAESDPVGQFVAACLDRGGGHGSLPAKVVYGVYREWCQENALDEIKGTGFGRRMSDLGFERLKSNTIKYRGVKWSEYGYEIYRRIRDAAAGDGAAADIGGGSGDVEP